MSQNNILTGSISVKAQDFLDRRRKLAALVLEGHEFCCGAHQKVFFDIQQLATSDKPMTTKQMDFARDIWMGRATHKVNTVDPNAAPSGGVTVKCVHRSEEVRPILDEEGKDTGKTTKVYVPCAKVITGTRAQLGEWGTRCEDHRS